MCDMNSGNTKSQISKVSPAGENHQVLSIEGGRSTYRREPCSDCPWRTDATGLFPAEAFRHSAITAYDMSLNQFGCHQSGPQKPATCAGFLLRGADHNMSVRIAKIKGLITDDVHDGGHKLHDSYRAMAIANGVDPDDPEIAPCR